MTHVFLPGSGALFCAAVFVGVLAGWTFRDEAGKLWPSRFVLKPEIDAEFEDRFADSQQ